MKELRDYTHRELIDELYTRLATGPAPEPAPAPAAPAAPAGPKQYPAVCSTCSKPTLVPFEPTKGYPILCKECYLAKKNK